MGSISVDFGISFDFWIPAYYRDPISIDSSFHPVGVSVDSSFHPVGIIQLPEITMGLIRKPSFFQIRGSSAIGDLKGINDLLIYQIN